MVLSLLLVVRLVPGDLTSLIRDGFFDPGLDIVEFFHSPFLGRERPHDPGRAIPIRSNTSRQLAFTVMEFSNM